MDHHPPPSDFGRLFRGELSASETRALVVHLLRGCPICAARLYPDLGPDSDYDGLFERLARPRPTFSHASASRLWEELEALPAEQRRLVLQKRRYRSAEFVSWLTRLSRETADRAPDAALLAAETAALVVDQLAEHAELSEDLARELRALAVAHQGNALRALGRFDQSLRAFFQSTEALGTDSDRLTRAEVLYLRAFLFRDLGRLDEAAQDLRASYRLGANFEPHTRGRILLQLAEVVGHDNPAAAVEILGAAARRLDPAREPSLQLSLAHWRAWFLNDAGRPTMAQEVLRSTWPVYGPAPEPRTRGLRAWLWARIERSFGDVAQAQVYLSRAVDLFREIGEAQDHAVSGLDLADVYLRLGRGQEARSLLLESSYFLESHLHLPGLERWLSVAGSASLSPDLLSEAMGYFRRFWYVPPAA